ncbi:MAG: phage portal protein [Methylocystis sp.]|nr:phage portal protein [Methylocystis sp.]
MATILSRLRSALAPGNAASRPDATKASRTGPLIALSAHGRPVWTPRDYAGFAREGFMINPVAHRSIRMIAEAAASVTLDVSGPDAGDVAAAASLLAAPNPRQAGTALLEALFLQLHIAGNAYLECVMLDGGPRELHVLRSDRMRVVPGPDGWPEAYEYVVAGQSVRFQAAEGPSPILHLTLTHPADDHYGLSALESAATAIDIHNEASRWNKAFLDNAARPSGALVYAADGANMSEEQFDRLKRELEEGFQGASNAGRPLLLEGGLDWKPLSLSPTEMDFIQLKNMAAREIALALGVPPLVLGLAGDNTHANYAQAHRVFWRQCVAPLVKRTAQSLSLWLSQQMGSEIRLTPDFDGVDAMNDTREPLWKAVTAADFLTVDEKRAALGYPPMAKAPASA